ncbi:helix-turn-helix domain-containing protein [Acinetobacter terrae]|uniref:Helix-turn-helix transcriptional regulator n=1 Tax=Acinetobacter terrae TaxID=2731247 RepID=A0A8E4FCI1_9GAMM|nr:helix-turn-helix transcriptional regulator [Acinetobacter terrae]NNH38084.1 helix-turn-helix transcriptional regulator [Acinetobacter terrae]
MIRCMLSALMGERKILKLSEVAQATGINRNTLTSLYYDRAIRIELSVADTLCKYFDCTMQDLFEYSNEPEKEDDIQ